jgi:phage tail sheath gpL-like
MNFEINAGSLAHDKGTFHVYFGNIRVGYMLAMDEAKAMVAKLDADPNALMVAALESMNEEWEANLNLWKSWKGNYGAKAAVKCSIYSAQNDADTLNVILERIKSTAVAA